MPTRSSGCAVCRKRKIKCDGGRPTCKNCVTHGAGDVCHYRTEQAGGLEFMDETQSIVKRVKKKYSVSSSVTGSTSTGSPSPSIGTSSLAARSPSTAATSVYDDNQTTADFTNLVKRTSSISLKGVMSPAVNRVQIHSSFLNAYLPDSPPIDHSTLFRSIVSRSSNEPSLIHGFDALSLITVGTIYKDQDLIQNAVRLYGQSLRSLATAISNGGYKDNDDVLTAAVVLANCEFYDEIAQTGHGWSKHVDGAQQLFKARGPQSIQSERALLLLSNARHGSLSHAIIERRAPIISSPEWRAAAFRSPRRDSATYFYDFAIQVPGLLERHDKLHSGFNTTVAEIDVLIRDCKDIEAALRDWFADWNAFASFSGEKLFDLRPIEEFTVFTGLCSNRTFTQGYIFQTFPIGYLTAQYWLSMFELRTTIQSISQLRRDLAGDACDEPPVPESELLQYVFDLCRCIPFFVEPISACVGSVAIFLPLRTAALYFAKRKLYKELGWVGAVHKSVFIFGMSPPNINDPPGTMSLREHSRLTDLG